MCFLHWLLFKNRIILTFSGSRQFLLSTSCDSCSWCTRSTGIAVETTVRYLRATIASFLNSSLLFQNSSAFTEMLVVFQYFWKTDSSLSLSWLQCTAVCVSPLICFLISAVISSMSESCRTLVLYRGSSAVLTLNQRFFLMLPMWWSHISDSFFAILFSTFHWFLSLSCSFWTSGMIFEMGLNPRLPTSSVVSFRISALPQCFQLFFFQSHSGKDHPLVCRQKP